jgi:hypothetical protein
MLWYCRFQWQPGVTAQQVRERVVAQHEAGTNRPERIRGWYNLAGGGAGFLVSWDVHAVYELSYDETIQEFQQAG